jgi:transposase
VITNVETTPATTPDDHMLTVVHQSLAKSESLPSEHLVDMGYTGCHMLVGSQQRHGVVVVGPVVEDTSWQAHSAEGFSKANFHIDWDQQVVACPEGKQSISWLPSTYPKSGMQFEARFARKDCADCPMRSRCTRSKVEPRIITLQAREDYEALQSARINQVTEEFRRTYAARSGIEGTHAQAIRRCGLRKCRYIGLAKTRLQHVITAVAVNLLRVAEWYNDTHSANTRIARFAALQAVA